MQFLSNPQLGIQKDLDRLLQRAPRQIKITGSDSPFLLSSLIQSVFEEGLEATVVLTSTPKDLRLLEESFRLTWPLGEIQTLPEFDVWPHSGLYPSPQLAAQRVGWCARLLKGEPGVYIATARSMAQWTMPKNLLQKAMEWWKVDQELNYSWSSKLEELGYRPSPFVEDFGQYSLRGSILDLFCPYYKEPLRIEFFGDTIESIRRFDPTTQRSIESQNSCWIIPCRELDWSADHRMFAAQNLKQDFVERGIEGLEDSTAYLQNLAQGRAFPGAEYLTSLFYEQPGLPHHFLDAESRVWILNPIETLQATDQTFLKFKEERALHPESPLNLKPEQILSSENPLTALKAQTKIFLSKIDVFEEIGEDSSEDENLLHVVASLPQYARPDSSPAEALQRVNDEIQQGFRVLLGVGSETQRQRLRVLLEQNDIPIAKDFSESPQTWEDMETAGLYLFHQNFPETLRLPHDHILFLRDKDLLPKKTDKRRSAPKVTTEAFTSATFHDLKVGDNIVHSLHGVGVFEGLKVMVLNGVEAEYLEIRYKGKDRLYLPIYRLNQIHKYGGSKTNVLDKLGGLGWEKTKTRVKKRLREMADDLLKLYALRRSSHRTPVPVDYEDFWKFCDEFPFEETQDQLKALEDIKRDFSSDSPMDRLICGDVGFGKTEIAMRAAFLSASQGGQVAVLAPTTILTFQHFENFKARFRNWPMTIRLMNRFVSPAEIRKTIAELELGQVDIVIGTHKLLNRAVKFKNLGLLVIDEEQKFGVAHKERMRQMRVAVDTLSMSATPLPRTLNMSFIGMRDLSLINTAPIDRLPTRTFVTKFDKETVRRAVMSEVDRGGQVFFLHNRVQSIYAVADELRQLLPGVRLSVGHGQMEEKDLEKTMVDFFSRKTDVLVCTTIIEAGMDIPNANTMFIDDAQRFGLSQLYQLRGRVGRSKKRAYCYLLIPSNRTLDKDAQERLRVIQENTALGSGLVIAQHDLELRGAGTLLGEEQSGHIDSVGYEMFLELMEEAMSEAKGEELEEKINPEMNLRIPALIPSSYIPDLRVRLSLYRKLSMIKSGDDLDEIENDLRDQFGKIPPEVLNLMGVMLICAVCRELGIKDLSSGLKSVSLSFSERTKLNPTDVVDLAMRSREKFNLTPDNRLIIRTDPKDWPLILEELLQLKKLLPQNAPIT